MPLGFQSVANYVGPPSPLWVRWYWGMVLIVSEICDMVSPLAAPP